MRQGWGTRPRSSSTDFPSTAGKVERRFGRVVAVSSAMVKTPIPVMSLSHGTRLGLAGILNGLSKDVVAHNVTVNQLLPERFDTGRQQQMAELVMKFKGITYDEARAEQIASIKVGRIGRPDEFGDAFAYLCSAQAGYLSGGQCRSCSPMSRGTEVNGCRRTPRKRLLTRGFTPPKHPGRSRLSEPAVRAGPTSDRLSATG